MGFRWRPGANYLLTELLPKQPLPCSQCHFTRNFPLPSPRFHSSAKLGRLEGCWQQNLLGWCIPCHPSRSGEGCQPSDQNGTFGLHSNWAPRFSTHRSRLFLQPFHDHRPRIIAHEQNVNDRAPSRVHSTAVLRFRGGYPICSCRPGPQTDSCDCVSIVTPPL